jgi:hypothetical protein
VSFAAISLCVASQRVIPKVKSIFRYRLSPETFGTFVSERRCHQGLNFPPTQLSYRHTIPQVICLRGTETPATRYEPSRKEAIATLGEGGAYTCGLLHSGG